MLTYIHVYSITKCVLSLCGKKLKIWLQNVISRKYLQLDRLALLWTDENEVASQHVVYLLLRNSLAANQQNFKVTYLSYAFNKHQFEAMVILFNINEMLSIKHWN